jgi:hypothetical protein
MKKVLLIFFSSVVLDTLWQNLHVFLYANYKGREITEFILLRAVLFDAIVIVLITAPFLFSAELKKRGWLIIVFGIIVSILIEWWGLSTGRWAYNSLMPMIPLLRAGLTPTLQLGLIGYASFKITEKLFK